MVLLQDGYLGMGKYVRDFEQALESILGRPSVCVNSGTAALHLAIESIISPGDEVLVPTITYVATYQAILAAGGVPVSVDVNEHNLCLDIDDAEKKLTPESKVIIPVWYAGNGEDFKRVYRFAKENSLRVIEDAAHAFGTTIDKNGVKIGESGDVACFSFDGIKNITCGEGGAIVSSDPTVLEYCKNARLLGVCNDSETRYSGNRSWLSSIVCNGYRYHMSNLNAAIGLVQLDKFPVFSKARRELANYYVNALSNVKAITCLDIDFEKVVPHIFPVLLPEGADRVEIRRELKLKGIETGVHYFPNHMHQFFEQQKYKCPSAEKLFPRLLTLPMHPEVTQNDADYIVKELISCLEPYL
ncbi:MAG: DegT/DnrJ/EryC1/StrS family aminotransferase [Aestuariibacter sp.]